MREVIGQALQADPVDGRAEAFAHLREQPRSISGICPTHPETLRLYRLLAEQLIAAHPGTEYFHLGGDEANTVGQCPRCERTRARGSKAKLVSGFTNKIIRFLAGRGVKPMMWADMLFGHLEDPEAVSRYARDMFADLSRDVIAADWDYWSTGPRTPSADRSPYLGIAGFEHLSRLTDAGFSVVGFPSSSHAFNSERNAIDHILAFRNITAFAKELKRRGCLGMVDTFWPTDALGQAWWHDIRTVSHRRSEETADVFYSQIRPGLEAHWYTIWRSAECAWSRAPRSKADYDRAFARLFLGAPDTSYPDALELASIPIDTPALRRRSRIPQRVKKQRLRKASALMRKAFRSARRGRDTVAYSDLFVRIQYHEMEWKEFHDRLSPIAMPKLSQARLRLLEKLAAERKALEGDFRRIYTKVHKDVHLEEEVRIRFAEERRLQEQLLWAQERGAAKKRGGRS